MLKLLIILALLVPESWGQRASLNLATAMAGFNNGTWKIYVRAVGQPLMLNKMSAEIEYVKD